MMATRRSPRSVESFCNNLRFGICTFDDTALLLSLAQCTGWSADRICLQMKEITKLENLFVAEEVWTFHSEWSRSRGGLNPATKDDVNIMKTVIKVADMQLEKMGRPLNRTVQPTTIGYNPLWHPKNNGNEALLPGFTPIARGTSKRWCSVAHQNVGLYANPTPLEELVISELGNALALIVKDILNRWAEAMWAKKEKDPASRPIPIRDHLTLAMQYLDRYQEAYEMCFGAMEHIQKSSIGDDVEATVGTVYIKSTGHAAKVFLGLIMADRLHAMERFREQERQEICFLEVQPNILEEDSKNCVICQDEMGVENPEGITETPLQMVICCGQYIGDHCLKTWLDEISIDGSFSDSCPVCRFVFPQTFLDKLAGTGEDKKPRAENRTEIESLYYLLAAPASPGRRTARPAALRPRVLSPPVEDDSAFLFGDSSDEEDRMV